MRARIPIQCGNETHWLTIEDDGTLSVDPDKHDVKLELTLADLGGDPSVCVELHQDWTKSKPPHTGKVINVLSDYYSPSIVVAGASRMLRPYIERGIGVRYPLKALEYIQMLLSGDISPERFAQEAFPTPMELSVAAHLESYKEKRLHEAAHHLVTAALASITAPPRKQARHPMRPWRHNIGSHFSYYMRSCLTKLAIASGKPMLELLQELARQTHKAEETRVTEEML
jgi:hypothetical protein